MFLAACAARNEWSPDNLARFSASQDWSCPKQRLTVVDKTPPLAAPAAPPEAIANDKARLAIWRKNRPVEAHRDRAFLVSGCGESAMYKCKWVSIESNGEEMDSYGCVLQ